jgi:translation initiation factor 1 (eIF-1/SUI1)
MSSKKIIDDNISELEINIRVSQRNGRKSITTIEDMPAELFNNTTRIEQFLSKLKTLIASRATIKSDDDGNKFIEFSGNKVDTVINWICDFAQCSASNIKIHGQV